MRCIKCGHNSDKVIDSRESKDSYSIRRRRECLNCGHRFTTYEQIERNDLHVIKRNGTREPFDRQKLFGGMLKACEKRPVSVEALESATDEVITLLQGEGLREIPTSAIGPKVMATLQKIDPVAYVRYASVYRQFADVGEFLDEIRLLNDHPKAMDIAQPDFFR